MLYRTDKVSEPPDSWEALWDPAFAGKIALYDDKSSLYMTARILFGRDAPVFALDDAALAAVRDKLIVQKPLLRKYWSSASELISLYATGDVWISDSWGRVSAPLRDQGLPVANVVPRERANAWADAWQIVRGAENLDCVYAWLNFTLSAEAQCGMQALTGFYGVNPVALAGCADAGAPFEGDQVAEYVFWREPDGLLRYIDSWTAVKAAE
jgi:spermidine/putrescine-binding protein